MRIPIRIKEIVEAAKVPKSNPPLDNGFVKKSPNVAPNGLVNINATQKRRIGLIVDFQCRIAMIKIIDEVIPAPCK